MTFVKNGVTVEGPDRHWQVRRELQQRDVQAAAGDQEHAAWSTAAAELGGHGRHNDHHEVNPRRLREEDGIALVMALGITVVLIIFVASMISYTSQNSRNANSQPVAAWRGGARGVRHRVGRLDPEPGCDRHDSDAARLHGQRVEQRRSRATTSRSRASAARPTSTACTRSPDERHLDDLVLRVGARTPPEARTSRR